MRIFKELPRLLHTQAAYIWWTSYYKTHYCNWHDAGNDLPCMTAVERLLKWRGKRHGWAQWMWGNLGKQRHLAFRQRWMHKCRPHKKWTHQEIKRAREIGLRTQQRLISVSTRDIFCTDYASASRIDRLVSLATVIHGLNPKRMWHIKLHSTGTVLT